MNEEQRIDIIINGHFLGQKDNNQIFTKFFQSVKVELICFSLFFQACNYNLFAQEIHVYRANKPVIDGYISVNEYPFPPVIKGTAEWIHEANETKDSTDLSLKMWCVHDEENLYFAFDVTDDVLYGIDTERWLPDEDQRVHDFSLESSPWFGDGIEIFLNPSRFSDSLAAGFAKGNGLSWQMLCSTHKSFLYGTGKGGLIEGNPRTEEAWSIYRNWIKSGAMEAAVRMKSFSEGRGYIIEWRIAFNPCIEIMNGVFWNSHQGIAKIGFNIEVQDLDTKDRGLGNFYHYNHIDVLAGQPGRKSELKEWGSLIIHP